MTLYKMTMNALEEANKTPEDIICVLIGGTKMTWEDFSFASNELIDVPASPHIKILGDTWAILMDQKRNPKFYEYLLDK